MNLSAVFIRRPVMTTLVTLAIILAGALGYLQLPINNIPKVELPTLAVTANLPGASPETMATTVATVLERQFSTIAGIDSMNSSSMLGVTTITLQFNLDRSIDSAAQDVQTAIAAAIPLLPPMPTRPTTKKVNPADFPILFLEIHSPTLPMSQLDEYAQTLVGQRLSMVDGVAQVQIIGSQKYAVRIQVDPERLSAAGIGIDQVARAISSGTVKRPTGLLSGPHQAFSIQSNDQLLNAAAFRKLVVTVRNGVPVHLENVATVLDDVENRRVMSWSRHGRAIIIGIYRQPNTNGVKIVDDVRALLPGLREQMPPAAGVEVLVDRSTSIRESVRDVGITLAITVVLVVAVIFVFLRNLAATAIPTLSLPASIIGTFAVMALMDFCLDDISLMAITLCVGFVVDDSIVVLEAIVRHLEHGKDPMTAAYEGSREVAFTVVSMTLSLVAVFVPILFLGGLVGRVFREFAVTITAAILISGFVSLSLTPMLCSRFLRAPGSDQHGRIYHWLERGFSGLLGVYAGTLQVALRWRRLVLVAAVLLVGLTFHLLAVCPKGFIPTADTGYIFGNTEAVQAISFDDMVRHQAEVTQILRSKPYIENFMSAVGGGLNPTSLNTGRVFMHLKPRSQRALTADQIIQDLRRDVARVPGLKLYMQNPPAIRLGGQNTKGLYQLTLLGTELNNLYQGVDRVLARLKEMPEIQDPTQDIQPRSLQVQVEVDRDKAAALGLTSLQVDQALARAYGGGQAATLYTADNEYQVVLEVKPRFYSGPEQLDRLYVTTRGGKLVPLRAFAHVVRTVGPLSVTHFGQLPSATISFNLRPGTSLSQAVDRIKDAYSQLPKGVTASLRGNAQAFESALTDMLELLVVAILLIYIVLGILYESFVHPLTILTGLPSAGIGAVVMLLIFGRELDVYGFLGLILLIGIVKKNAIMMVDHALECERVHGMDPEAAIVEASVVRFRPILMTTVAALMGSLPLATGWGAGGEARQPLGLAVVGGLLVSQLLTLYITPVIYLYFDRWFLSRSRRTKE